MVHGTQPRACTGVPFILLPAAARPAAAVVAVIAAAVVAVIVSVLAGIAAAVLLGALHQGLVESDVRAHGCDACEESRVQVRVEPWRMQPGGCGRE